MKTNKTEIQKNYFDALFFANATSTEKLPFHISPAEFKLMVKLVHYHNDQKNITWSSENISKQTSMSIGVIDKSIQRLKQKGYINTSTYNTDTYTKHRTIFINWNKIEEVNDLYLKSTEKEAPQAPISTQPIPEVQVEEKVSEIEDNTANGSTEIKLQELRLIDIKELSDFKSKYNFFIPKVLLEYMYLVEGKLGFENKLKKIYNQTDFNLELLDILKEQHNKEVSIKELVL
jgi:DNA-binding MarR family transcriptional regulator